MRRQPVPLEQKLPETLGHARLSPGLDVEAQGGTAAGMPRFLNRTAAAATLESALEEDGSPAAVSAPQSVGAAPMNGQADMPTAEVVPQELPEVSGEGRETEVSAYSVTLRGRTDANFTSSFRTRNVRTTAATGCENCADSDCVHVTGTLVSTFRVSTTVTLPSVSDFPDLTRCQRQRVRDGINNVLAPHEQQHVAAFRTYNGTVSTPFDFTLCRSEFDGAVQDLHNSIEGPRQAAAQAASDALDPFEFEVDLDCEG